MFSKPKDMEVRSRSLLRAKDVKALKELVLKQMPGAKAVEPALHEFLPDKAQVNSLNMPDISFLFLFFFNCLFSPWSIFYFCLNANVGSRGEVGVSFPALPVRRPGHLRGHPGPQAAAAVCLHALGPADPAAANGYSCTCVQVCAEWCGSHASRSMHAAR